MRRLLLAAAPILVLAACVGPDPLRPSKPEPTLEQRVAALAEAEPFSVSTAAGDAALAVHLQILSDGVQVREGRILHTRLPTGSALPQLQVRALRGETVAREYAMPDPRIGEREGGGTTIRRAAETWIYLPVDGSLTRVEIVPTGTTAGTSQGGSFDPQPLLYGACAQHRKLEACAVLR